MRRLFSSGDLGPFGIRLRPLFACWITFGLAFSAVAAFANEPRRLPAQDDPDVAAPTSEESLIQSQFDAEHALESPNLLTGFSNDDEGEAADPLAERMQALEKELQSMKKKAADDKKKDEQKKKDAEEKKKADEKKKELDKKKEEAKKWTTRLGGHIQMDYVTYPNNAPPLPQQNYFEFRRLRLLADGTGYEVFDFRLQIDIEPEGGDGVITPVTDVKDAYLSMNQLPAVFERVRVGNFFVPYSLEQVTNDTNNIFMERSIPTQGIFAADREVGFAGYGVTEDKNITWTTGVFFDSISESLKERFADRQGTRVSGRLTWLPYYDECSNGRYLLHFGTGILWTDDQNRILRYAARPQVHEGPFYIDSGNMPAWGSTSGNVEMAIVHGPFSVQSELFLTHVNRMGAADANLYGAYVYLSWFLTGENRIYERFGQHGAQFARNVPYNNFRLIPGNTGWGALEFKVRTSYLDMNEIARGQYNDITTGFNWYWTDRIRMMFDWIHPFTTATTRPFGTTSSDLIAMRFDVNW